MASSTETASERRRPGVIPASPLRREVTPDGLLLITKALQVQDKNLTLNPARLRFSGTRYVLRVFETVGHDHISEVDERGERHIQYVRPHDISTTVAPGHILVELPAKTDIPKLDNQIRQLRVEKARQRTARKPRH